MKNMIGAGAAGVHFEDQLAAVKKCGHMGGKVLIPTQEAVQKLIAARLAADVMGVPTVVLARTDAEAANLLTSDVDDNDKPFLTGERTSEGFYVVKNGLEQSISRGVSYARYADMVWCETGTPDLGFAREWAEAVRAVHPGKLLAYNCSPSFNWKKNLDDKTIAEFQDKLAEMGYKYQFITLAGIHNMWYNMFDLAYDYARGEGMKHYVEKVQEPEFAAADKGYSFVSHPGSWCRLLRRRDNHDPGRLVLGDRDGGLYRGRAVLATAAGQARRMRFYCMRLFFACSSARDL
jgi:isocitrate lyase